MILSTFVKTLAGRLITFGLFPTVLAIGAIVGVSAIETQREMFESEKRLLSSSVRGVANELSYRNERWNNVVTTMSMAQTNGLFGQRKASSDFVKSISVSFPLIRNAYIAYEPNADGQDAASLKAGDLPPGSTDAAGRFVPCWKTMSGQTTVEPRVGMETRESYQGPKTEFLRSGQIAGIITEPDIRQGTAVITHAFPIVVNGKFVGCAGVDRDLMALQTTMEAIKSELASDVFVLSAGHRFIATTTEGKLAAGETSRLALQDVASSPYAPLATQWRATNGGVQVFEAIDPVLGEPCIYATTTAATGGWNVVLRRKKNEVLGPANAAMIHNIILGGVGVLVVGGLLFAVSRSVSNRVKSAGIRLYSTATEIGATSKLQEATASTFGAASSQIAAAVKEISATGKDLVRTMESVSENAVETATLAGSGKQSLQGMESVMHNLDRATTSISEKLGAINERSQKITTVITTITKVADQTNILSINAAIEAEKAGEFGSGFLVIAREIRRLADQTASATLDIEQMVQQMQAAVSSGVMEMDRFSDQVRRGVRDVASTGTQLTEIIDRVNRSTDTFKTVNESMQAQSEGAEQISSAMTSLTSNAQQTMQSVQEFARASADLQTAIAMLRQAVGDFKE